MLYITSTTVNYMHQLCFLILNPFSLIHLHALQSSLFLLWCPILNLCSPTDTFSTFLQLFSVVLLSRLFLSFVFAFPISALFALLFQKYVLTFLSLLSCSIFSLSMMENKQLAKVISENAESGVSKVCGNLPRRPNLFQVEPAKFSVYSQVMNIGTYEHVWQYEVFHPPPH